MSSTALYRAFIDAGASEQKATLAAELSKCPSYRNWQRSLIC